MTDWTLDERVRHALGWISAACSHDDWVEIGQAVHSEWPDDRGYAIWAEWSASAPDQFSDSAARAAWKSFQAGGKITLGTLFHRAKRNGWDDPSRADKKPDFAPLPPAGKTQDRKILPPPPEGLDTILKACRHVWQVQAAKRWFHTRHLHERPEDIICGVLPDQLATREARPSWWPITKTPEGWAAMRLVIPCYDATGARVTVSCRMIDGQTLKMKASRPKGYQSSGTIMANAAARRLLTGDIHKTERVIITEGEPDFLTRCQTHPQAAVFGVYAGSIKPAILDRIPDGCKVYIEVDRDKQGHVYAAKIAKLLKSRCQLFITRADVPTGDVNDRHCRGELLDPEAECEPYAPIPKKPQAEPPPHPADNAAKAAAKAAETMRPILFAQVQERELLAAIWEHLLPLNAARVEAENVRRHAEPLFLAPGGRLVRLAYLPHADGSDRLDIQTMDQIQVEGILGREFDWLSETAKGDLRPRDPKDRAVKLVHGDAAQAPAPGLPVLQGIASTPILAPDGRLIECPGYHEACRLWMAPSADLAAMEAVPEHPSAEDVARARALILDELLVDFPFISDAERATAVAALLLPFVRRCIDGPTPIHLFDAPVQGSGKSLLARQVGLVATGERVGAITLNANEEETQKLLAAELMRGRSLIVMDNIDTTQKALNSPALASITTDTTWSARKLGASEVMDLPNQATWILTGNNVQVSRDLVRRFVRSRIDPGSEKPWLREPKSFRHADLTAWTTDHRAELVHACLTIARAWVATGKPSGPRVLGSFEAWSNVMGGLLTIADVPGFLDGIEDFYGLNQGEADAWEPFIFEWWDKPDLAAGASVRQLVALCEDHNLMTATMGDKSPRSMEIRLGKAMQAARDRVVAGFRIAAARDTHKKTWTYILEPMPGTDTSQRTVLVDEDDGLDLFI